MFLEVLSPKFFLPNLTNAVLMDFVVVPPGGAAWAALQNTSRWIGRFSPKGGSITNLTTQTSPVPQFGTADVGLEVGGGLDLTNTTVQSGSTTPLYPYNRIRVSGTSGAGATAARLVLMIGGPVSDVVVTYAAAGLPYVNGDSLLDPKFGLSLVQ